MKANSKHLILLRTELAKVADSTKAAQMQAYMKSQMPYHGVPAPVFKKVCKSLFADMDVLSFEDWQNEVLTLWRNAKFREERYGALYLAGHSTAKIHQTPKSMDMYEELIVTGAWWDYVDDIAVHRVGDVLRGNPKPMKRLLLKWSKSDNIWKRRSAIISQIASKENVDLDFLYNCIEPSMGAAEFFLRKAIGWSLRQVAWRDPAEVIRYVKKNRERLSPLSKREALKNIIKAGKLKAVP